MGTQKDRKIYSTSRKGKCFIKDEICYIPLQNNLFAICDANRIDEVNKFSWYLDLGSKYQYVVSKIKNKHQKLHRFLYPQYLIIDHINRDKLNNMSSNLREVSPLQNGSNKTMQNNNKSGYKGVSYLRGKWQSYITFNNKRQYLGVFDSKIEAAKKYNEFAIKYFKEYSSLNIIKEGA